MASLNHVCMWQENHWVRITASEAARIHPGGTVSARSGLFMCELCGQFVTLTDAGAMVRHFRHSSKEAVKDCPERTFAYGRTYTMVQNGEHELPIRISGITEKNYSLEIGLIKVPEELITSRLKIEIKSTVLSAPTYVYSSERLNKGGITYLPVGNWPATTYTIDLRDGNEKELRNYWPKTVQGVHQDHYGMVFDEETGRKLPYDGDVTVRKKYLLLTINKIGPESGVSSHIRSVVPGNRSSWKLYEIMADSFSAEAARFFQTYHCRLTERPVAIQVVWPPYIESPYVLKHGKNSMIFHVSGNAPHMDVFPKANMRSQNIGVDDKVLEICSKSRQQMISAGRAKVLQYTYYWREELNNTQDVSEATVQDLKGRNIESGISSELPCQETLRIRTPYDGSVTVLHENTVTDRKKISADAWCEIYGITWKDQIKVYVGLDCVWQKLYVRKTRNDDAASVKILDRVKRGSGEKIATPHAMKNMAADLTDYPELQKCVLIMIRRGWVYRNTYRELQNFVTSVNQRKR